MWVAVGVGEGEGVCARGHKFTGVRLGLCVSEFLTLSCGALLLSNAGLLVQDVLVPLLKGRFKLYKHNALPPSSNDPLASEHHHPGVRPVNMPVTECPFASCCVLCKSVLMPVTECPFASCCLLCRSVLMPVN